ncbi:Fatty-acid amide hydrolase 2 [Halotydeus destructor]|nr:Fatty-acid amide hydrolase 2 [Halotydeus destructor]
MSATDIANNVRDGVVSAEQVVKDFLSRVDQVNGKLNAIIDLRAVEALEAAQAIDRQLTLERAGQVPRDYLDKPLLGVPLTLKDSIAARGFVHDGAILSNKGHRAARDSIMVSQMKQAGAVIMGITNTPQAMGSLETDNKLYGRTNNPYDLSLTASGSSGGEGSAVGSAMSVIGIGSDMLGSVRLPALCCGVFGHKPTNQVMDSMDALVPPYCPTFKRFYTCGPLVRYTKDLVPMVKAMADPARIDQLRLDEPVDLSQVKFYRVSGTSHPFISHITRDVSDVIDKACNHLQSKYGVDIPEVCPDYVGLTLDDCAAAVKDCHPTPIGNVVLGLDQDCEVNFWLELFKCLTGFSGNTFAAVMAVAFEYFAMTPDAEQRKDKVAKIEADKLRLHELLGDNAVVLVPTLPYVAQKHDTILARFLDIGFSASCNLYEVPATHVTMGLTKDSVPVGFQVMAGPYQDRLSIAVAQEMEKVFGGWVPPCPVKLRPEDENLNLVS